MLNDPCSDLVWLELLIVVEPDVGIVGSVKRSEQTRVVGVVVEDRPGFHDFHQCRPVQPLLSHGSHSSVARGAAVVRLRGGIPVVVTKNDNKQAVKEKQ